MRRVGLQPVDSAFYHFTVFPRIIERRFPNFSARGAEKFEVFSRAPVLGYLANQYIVKARKVAGGNHHS
jgi:hypothetical protein